MDYGALIQLAATLAGKNASQGDRDKAMAALKAVLDRIQGQSTNLPELPPSEQGAVTANPEYVAHQKDELGALQNVVNEGGLTLGDRAVLNRTTANANRTAGANMNRILRDMQARGAGSSGATMAAQMAEGQNAAERANEAGSATAGMAQQRVLDAMKAKAGLAGEMGARDFDQRMRSAEANDLRNKYNYGTRKQQEIENALQAAGIAGGAANPYASALGQNANRTQDYYSNLGAGAAEFAKSAGKSGEGSGSGSSAYGSLGYDASGNPYYSNPDDWENPYGGY